MTPLEYLLFGINMVFLLSYLKDFENLQHLQSIAFEDNYDTGKSYYYVQQRVSAFGFQPSIMFSI
jgi:hypothetical protein